MTQVVESMRDSELLATINSCLDALLDDQLRLPSDREALDLVLASLQVDARLHAWQRLALEQIETSQAAWHEHHTSTTTWLAESGNLTPNQAKHLIRSGQRLRKFNLVGQASAAGKVLPAQADAIADVLVELPQTFPAEIVTEAQELMIGFAADHNSTELRRLTSHLVEVLSPETADEIEERRLERQRRRAESRRHLEFRGDGDGSVLIRGSLPICQAEPFIQIIDAYAAAQKRALDALDPDAPMVTPGMRRADALMAMVQQHSQDALAPSSGGDRPRVILTLSYEKLRQAATAVGLGARLVRSGQPLPAGEVRQLLCDAEILPFVLGGRSEVLDVGRSQRLVTGPIRAALELRDGGCVFPGCDKPPPACHAHHLKPWWAGGATALPNLVLVCPHHHGIVEPGHDPTADRWQIELGADGLPQVRPPQRVDVHQQPRQHARFRTKNTRE